jgi:hypothetical protein
MAAVMERLLITPLEGLGSRSEREAAGGLEQKPGSDKHLFDMVDFHFLGMI